MGYPDDLKLVSCNQEIGGGDSLHKQSSSCGGVLMNQPAAPSPFPFKVTIVYVIIFLTGVIGNVIVCVVIVRHSTMHTATNYYLFSLAVSDLLFLLMGKCLRRKLSIATCA